MSTGNVWEMPVIDLLRAIEPLVILATLSIMITFYLTEQREKTPPFEKFIAMIYLAAFLLFSFTMFYIIANQTFGLVILLTLGLALFFVGSVLIWYEVFVKTILDGIKNFIRK